jgi:DNA replication and repair protein RecF
MRIEQLRGSNVRKLKNFELEPGDDLNIFFGKNGSGKTSLLESIHLLGYGRSFRTRRTSEVVTKGESVLDAFCVVDSQTAGRSRIGLEKTGSRTRIRVNGDDLSSSSGLARRLPVIFIGPDCSRLLEESELRRRVINWIMFHVEPQFLVAYQRFNRALRQRNAALRKGVSTQVLRSWDHQLVGPARNLHALRLSHMQGITDFASKFLQSILSIPIEVEFKPGWDTYVDYEKVLADGESNDRRLGYTLRGPQRADISLRTRDVAARTVLSRGEGKLLAMGVQLAQAAYFARQREETPILMVDDLGTELDEDSQGRFMSALRSIEAQTYVTTVVAKSAPLFPAALVDGDRVRAFHVEQGTVQQVL